jgi:hypothetical protein
MEAQKIKWGKVYLNHDCDGMTKHPFFIQNSNSRILILHCKSECVIL